VRVHVVATIFALAFPLISCNQVNAFITDHYENEAAEPLFSDSNMFHVFSIQPYWMLYHDSTIAPSDAEKADWLSERRDANGLVKFALMPQDFEYSDIAINAWIEKGDPVAMYLKAFQLYSRYGCKASEEIVPLLENSYAVESGEDYVFEGKRLPEKRVPEAALALYHLAQVCPRTLAMKTPAIYQEMAKQGGMVDFHYTIPYKE